jgi:hypothetical protein
MSKSIFLKIIYKCTLLGSDLEEILIKNLLENNNRKVLYSLLLNHSW